MSGFSYSGPSLAATFVAGVFNDAEGRATAAGVQASTEFGTARGVLGGIPDSRAASFLRGPTLAPVTVDLSPLINAEKQLDNVLDTRAAALGLSDLLAQAEQFLSTFFPGVDDAVASARTGLMALFGTSDFANGKRAARLRVDMDQARTRRGLEAKEDELMRTYADRNYPMPPGMLVEDLTQLRVQQLHDLTDKSLEIDAAELARERENLERALRLLVSSRAQAIQAVGSYLAGMCAARYSALMAQTQASYAEAQVMTDALYQQLSATSRAAALQIRAGDVDHQLGHGFLQSLDQLAQQQVDLQLQAALAMAKMLGAQAATAYNNMRASASVQSSEEIDEL